MQSHKLKFECQNKLKYNIKIWSIISFIIIGSMTNCLYTYFILSIPREKKQCDINSLISRQRRNYLHYIISHNLKVTD